MHCRSVIIDDLTKRLATESRLIGLAYVYCDFRDPADFGRISASILKQLLLLLGTIPPLLRDRFEQLKSASKVIHNSELTRLIHDIVAKFSHMYIVIDALDELYSDVGSDVVLLLQQLQSKGANVLVLSRAIHSPEISFPQPVSVKITADRKDIEAYLHKKIEISPCSDLVVGDFKLKMVSLITDKTDGG
jgi:hypothetical protein